ncbi:MAG: hypothetical protein QW594_00815 [Candidatus Woesearchaeota archaeon]
MKKTKQTLLHKKERGARAWFLVLVSWVIIGMLSGCATQQPNNTNMQNSEEKSNENSISNSKNYYRYQNEGLSFAYPTTMMVNDSAFTQRALIVLKEKEGGDEVLISIQLIPLARYRTTDQLLERLVSQVQVLQGVNTSASPQGFRATFWYKKKQYLQEYRIERQENAYLVVSVTAPKEQFSTASQTLDIIKQTLWINPSHGFGFLQLPLDVPITVYGKERNQQIAKALEDFIASYPSNARIIIRAKSYFASFRIDEHKQLYDLQGVLRSPEEIVAIIDKDLHPGDEIKIMAIY